MSLLELIDMVYSEKGPDYRLDYKCYCNFYFIQIAVI